MNLAQLEWFLIAGFDDTKWKSSILQKTYSKVQLVNRIEYMFQMKERDEFRDLYQQALQDLQEAHKHGRAGLSPSSCSVFGGLRSEWEIHAVCFCFLSLPPEQWQRYVQFVRPLADGCVWLHKKEEDGAIRRQLKEMKGTFESVSPQHRHSVLELYCCLCPDAFERFWNVMDRMPLAFFTNHSIDDLSAFETRLDKAVRHVYPNLDVPLQIQWAGLRDTTWLKHDPKLRFKYLMELQRHLLWAWALQMHILHFLDEVQAIRQKYQVPQPKPKFFTRKSQQPLGLVFGPAASITTTSMQELLGHEQYFVARPPPTALSCSFVISSLPKLECSLAPTPKSEYSTGVYEF